MSRLAILLFGLLLAACGGPPPPVATSGDRPMRIVSLDYCADQYVLKLADRDQILALSPDATAPFSYMRQAAVGLRTVRPLAEDVLILKPDLVVRSYGGGPNAAAFFEQAGIDVLQLGFAASVDGDQPGSIPGLIQDVADGLGQAERGAALIADYRTRLAALKVRADRATALYMTPGGVTSGPGSLVHEMLLAAGLENFEAAPGWRSLPLERLAYEQPDLVAGAFFDDMANRPHLWSAARHPIARAQLEEGYVVPLQGAWTACGGWFLLDAVEALAEGASK